MRATGSGESGRRIAQWKMEKQLQIEIFLLVVLVLAMAYVIIMIFVHDNQLAADGNEYVGQVIVGILGFYAGKQVGQSNGGSK